MKTSPKILIAVILSVAASFATMEVKADPPSGRGRATAAPISTDNHKPKRSPNEPAKDKVTICHKERETLTIGRKAAEAHIRNHGDTPGACP